MLDHVSCHKQSINSFYYDALLYPPENFYDFNGQGGVFFNLTVDMYDSGYGGALNNSLGVICRPSEMVYGNTAYFMTGKVFRDVKVFLDTKK